MKPEDIFTVTPELIEDYINGLLSREALEAMELRIANDPELAKVIKSETDRLYRESGGSEERIQDARRIFEARTGTNLSGKPKMLWKPFYSMVAGIIPLFIFGWWAWGQIKGHNAELLYMNMIKYESSASDVEMRSPDRTKLTRFQEAIKIMEAGEYKRAESRFLSIDSSDSIFYADAQLHLIKVYLALDQIEKAQEQVDKMNHLIDEEYPFADQYLSQIEWFQTLTALKGGNFDKAKRSLNIHINENDGDFKRESALLDQKLNSIWFSLSN